jgi:hypothetical protein
MLAMDRDNPEVRHMLAMDRDNPEVRHMLAMDRDNPEVRHMLAMDRDNPEIHNERGETHAGHGSRQPRDTVVRHMLAMDRDNPEVRHMLAMDRDNPEIQCCPMLAMDRDNPEIQCCQDTCWPWIETTQRYSAVQWDGPWRVNITSAHARPRLANDPAGCKGSEARHGLAVCNGHMHGQ